MKSIALGQYYPSDSVIHKLDGRTKILLATIFIVAIFFCKSLASFAFLLVLSFAIIAMSKIPVRIVLRSLRAVIFILIFTFVINVFLTKGESDPLFQFGNIKVYAEGIWTALFIAIRILCLIIASSIFISFTTTPIQLTYSIESLLSPLKKIKVPVHEFSMMMSIALRFIPTLIEETDKIMNAQKARGADFNSGNLIKRAKALIPVLIPLFVSSIRRADDLATAMECRCYRGGEGRTRMKLLKYKTSDYLFLLFMIAVLGAVVVLNILVPILVL